MDRQNYSRRHVRKPQELPTREWMTTSWDVHAVGPTPQQERGPELQQQQQEMREPTLNIRKKMQ